MADQSSNQDGASTLGATTGADVIPAVPELSEKVQELEQLHSGKFSRTVQMKNGQRQVVVYLELDNGDKLAGRGTTTEEALTVLEQRLEAFANAQS